MADFKRFLEILMPWLHEVEAQGIHGDSLARIVLKYVIALIQQGDKDLLVAEAHHHLSPALQGEIMTIAQQWQDEGMYKGIQQGEATLLMRQIRHRFGDIPNPITQQITKADAQKLLVWGEKILDAANLEAIFAEDSEE